MPIFVIGNSALSVMLSDRKDQITLGIMGEAVTPTPADARKIAVTLNTYADIVDGA
jgi:hypothetical protein